MGAALLDSRSIYNNTLGLALSRSLWASTYQERDFKRAAPK
jgi:hypothetical protein